MWFFLMAVALVAAGTAGTAGDIVAPAGHKHAPSVLPGALAIVVGLGVAAYGVREFRRLPL
jgi:hypothetical protein